MNREILKVKPRIFSLEQSNDIYMTLNMCILTNRENLNHALFTDDFIDGVIANKEKYVGIPLVANRTKLENGQYTALSHEFDKKSGALKTDQIGSFVDFWDETDTDGIRQLMGSVKVFKRFPSVCEAIIELYDQNELEFSCEVLVFGYSDVNGSTRSISYESDGQVNELFGSCVVSDPAEPKSKATMLIAEALKNDLGGGEQVSDFNKGNEIKYHVESASITIEDISNQIYNILNPLNPRTSNREYNYWIRDLYNDKVVVEDWNEYGTYFSINYKIENDVVVLEDETNWIEGTIGFIPNTANTDDILNAIVVAQKEEKVKMDEELQALKDTNEQQTKTIAELMTFKEKFEAAEKKTKKDALVEKFTQLLSEEAMKSEAVVKAFDELDEATLNSIVVSEVAKEIASKTPEKKESKVVVSARTQEDLIPQNLRDRLYSPKSE